MFRFLSLLLFFGFLLPASAQIRTAPAEIAAMSDGGEIALPTYRQRVLIRQDSLWARALRLHYSAIVMDGHIDTPSLMLDDGLAFGTRHDDRTSHVDLPRMFDGGLDAPFFSIFVSFRYGEGAAAKQRADAMIDEVEQQVAANAARVEMAETAADVRRITRSGKKAILLGLEGGHALAADPANVAYFRARGIRYVTLTHVNTNAWADASQSRPRWGGLNDLGREMVDAMNRAGVLLDISHVSDETFFDAVAASHAPVIASHSSARALVQTVRNMSDEMLLALADNGGVVMINFYDRMVNQGLSDEVMQAVRERVEREYGGNMRMIWRATFEVQRARGIPTGSIEDVLDQIDHVAHLIGVDHVALGSDFDGVSVLPHGLEDVTRLPWLTYGLVQRGYSDEDIHKILGGNTLRVLEAAEQVAARLRQP